MATTFDPWDKLGDARRAVYEKGEAAALILRKYESIERWREIGEASAALMHDAMEHAGANGPLGPNYKQMWRRLAEHVPTVKGLDPAARSAAIWMVENWTEVQERLFSGLTPKERLLVNHPTVVRRRYEAMLKREEGVTADKPVSPRVRLQDQVIRLQEEVDLLRKKSGGGLMPSASVSDVTDALFEAHNPAFMRRLMTAVEKRLAAEERQDRIEAKGKPRKAAA